MAGIPQKIRANGNGDRCCRNTAGAVEFPWGWNLFLWELCEYALEILQTIKKILAASVRILSKLCREISCVTAFLSFENN